MLDDIIGHMLEAHLQALSPPLDGGAEYFNPYPERFSTPPHEPSYQHHLHVWSKKVMDEDALNTRKSRGF